MKITVVADPTELQHVAAERFVSIATEAIGARGFFSVALSGGSTPKKLYELLASDEFKTQLDWAKCFFFFGDERNVPPDSSESNYRMANEAMFSRLSEQLPPGNVHRVLGEQSAADAASDYERQLNEFFRGELPQFDLILLGMGDDGHTASLFPGSAALEENVRWFTENWAEKFGAYRLTLTFPVINNARQILFLIAGAEKQPVLSEILRGDGELKYPVQRVHLINGEPQWLIDQAAAGDGSAA